MKPNKLEAECIEFARKFYNKPNKSLFKKLFSPSEPEFNVDDCIVSNIKTFHQLWSDFGLRDYGVNYFHRGRFSDENKRICLIRWCSILYPNKVDVVDLEQFLIQKNSEKRKAYIAENPGGRIILQNPLDQIPELVDKVSNSYINPAENNASEFLLKRYMQTELSEKLIEIVKMEFETNPIREVDYLSSQIHKLIVLKSEEFKSGLKRDTSISHNEIDSWVDEVKQSILNQL